jgi:hypothetical protein
MTRAQISTSNPGSTGVEGGTLINANATLDDNLQTAVGVADGATAMGTVANIPQGAGQLTAITDTAKEVLDKHESRIYYAEQSLAAVASISLGANYNLAAAANDLRGTTYVTAGATNSEQYPDSEGLYIVEVLRSTATEGYTAGSLTIFRVSKEDDLGAVRSWIKALEFGDPASAWVETTPGATVVLTAPAGQTLEVTVNNDRSLTIGSPADEVKLQPAYPPMEGTQHQTLWSLSRYGTGTHIKVRAETNPLIGHTSHAYIATASLPSYIFADPTTIKIEAQGEYEAGSSDPRLVFCPAIGPDIPRPYSVIPEGGHVRGFVNALTAIGDASGIEASWRTLGENALGWGMGEKLHWRIEMTVETLPAGGADAFSKTGNGDGNVRVHGRIVLRKPTDQQAGFRAHPGPMFQTATNTWEQERGSGFPVAYDVSVGGKGYRSIWAQPSVPNPLNALDSGSSDALRLARLEDIDGLRRAQNTNAKRTFPGWGVDWRQHWYELEQEIKFDYCDTVVLTGFDDLQVSLKMGGPIRIDSGVTAPAWGVGGGGNYDPTLRRLDPAAADYPVVSQGGNTYCARFVHVRADSLEPGAGGESDRFWRELPADRADELKIYSTTATITGGRVGLSDFPIQ